MPIACELDRGFHISSPTSKVTPTQEGVYLPYDGYWGERMQALKAFVSAWYEEPERRFPYLFEDHTPLEEVVRQCRDQRERLSGNEDSHAEQD